VHLFNNKGEFSQLLFRDDELTTKNARSNDFLLNFVVGLKLNSFEQVCYNN